MIGRSSIVFVVAAWAALSGTAALAGGWPVTGSIVALPSDDGDGPGALAGAEPSGPLPPAPRDAAGHPELTGYWKPLRQKGKPTGNLGRDLPGFQLPLTAAGQAALAYNRTKTIDPEALCILGGIPRHDASGLPFAILQTTKQVAFLYWYQDYRLIPVDGRQRSPDPQPRFFGHPIGIWRGSTLVVDSVGFKDHEVWGDENADPVSGQVHTIERWSRPDAYHLHLLLTVDDPKFYTHSFDYSRTWVLGRPGEGLGEYACEENNIDAKHLGPGPGAIGPNGNRGADLPETLPDNPPSPDYYRNHAALR
ncbi:MAG TPA: hypothetical protein VHX52_09195 [Steroidobacteraceae bacterium]|jgi:hypothetical protein|nr:hypothetical protein [Steroidobacteraceae bacterium]